MIIAFEFLPNFCIFTRNLTLPRPADFEEAGRGAIAVEDMNIGDIALEIPESLVISEDLVYESDMVFCYSYQLFCFLIFGSKEGA